MCFSSLNIIYLAENCTNVKFGCKHQVMPPPHVYGFWGLGKREIDWKWSQMAMINGFLKYTVQFLPYWTKPIKGISKILRIGLERNPLLWPVCTGRGVLQLAETPPQDWFQPSGYMHRIGACVTVYLPMIALQIRILAGTMHASGRDLCSIKIYANALGCHSILSVYRQNSTQANV